MRSLIAGLFLSVISAACWSQAYPARPVRMVVGFAPGGGTDIIARLVAQKLGERWKQPVVVENRLGASGNIGAELVAKSAPDGYTLLLAFSSHASNAALSKLSFDINKDFSAITLVASGPAVVIAHPGVPGKTLGGLIAYAKAKPGAILPASSCSSSPGPRCCTCRTRASRLR
jgi:tripartite-type tricarboxylate transporter receptor subunit TctC